MVHEMERLSSRAHIVLVEDDALFREALGQNLLDAGFQVAEFDRGQPALDSLGSEMKPDLVILDWKMPGMNGIDVLKRLRETNNQVPVIFLTSLSDQVYEEAALTGGAVDFVEKSRGFAILMKRIDLILEGLRGARQAGGVVGEELLDVIKIGPLELRLDSNRATWRDKEVDLSLTEFKMVRAMAERAGQDVAYRQLYDLVHGKDFVAGYGNEGYRANVRTFVKRIRQKFTEIDPAFEQIENYAGFGYRWRAEGTQ
ncbi:MAG TPA: response regulator transcription factor [Candidatus Cybelea sp.]|nr:response regulator transcription factor [Candidatus Cybelea sp.]